ncbi:MAG: hypothetical protein PHN44_00600 [Candidatus Marinimicrobia bacterium]|nr:hypothetical protein [Candidatus Neomarinimicrobiota bacterium]MDD5539135.1 hypothetical protein [Candidatus Neomarinimicrobiota bacterium]
MAIEGFKCELKEIKPIKVWIDEEDPIQCRPCLISPLASHYAGALETAKAEPQLAALQKAWDSKDVLTIAETLDKIKEEVGEDLKNELLTLDCFTESFKPEEVAEKQQQKS